MKDDKKLAAAMAAVSRYLEIEASEESRPATCRTGSASGLNLWAFSGRLDRMQVRTLMQLRTFSRRIGPK